MSQPEIAAGTPVEFNGNSASSDEVHPYAGHRGVTLRNDADRAGRYTVGTADGEIVTGVSRVEIEVVPAPPLKPATKADVLRLVADAYDDLGNKPLTCEDLAAALNEIANAFAVFDRSEAN